MKTVTAILLACVLSAAAPAYADEVNDACFELMRHFGKVKDGLVRGVPETFEDDGKIYRGCGMTILGDFSKAPGTFAAAEPPPPSGRWKVDREADGPDGTSYRLARGNGFCLVNGAW